MHLSRSLRRTFAVWAMATTAGSAVGSGYALLSGNDAELGALIGLTICAVLVGLELFVVQRPLGAPLRRMKLPYFLALTTVVWTLLIVASLDFLPAVIAYYDEPHPRGSLHDLAFSFAVALALNFALRMRSLVGARVLGNLLLGRYHTPLREDRVFLFLDLADSTALAERLGDEGLQSLLSRFFFDVSQVVVEFGGETHRYIGDEVVVTWALQAALREGRCIRCVFAIRDAIGERAARYRAQFGVVPRFRVGMHGGSVVAGEVGDDKREIVYFGDTINTAARLADLCRELDLEFLTSGELLGRIVLPPSVQPQRIGPVELRGKQRTVEVFALARERSEAPVASASAAAG